MGTAALLLMASCSGYNNSEKTHEDSARIADSIAQVEAAKAAAERARLDSLRQDSIRRDSIRQDSIQKAFENQFLTPLEIVDKKDKEYPVKSPQDIKKILKAKGYKITNLNEDGFEWSAKKDGNNPITGAYYKQEIEVGCGARCAMTIEFTNKEEARKFYKKLEKYNSKYRLNETEYRKIWELEDNWIDVIV